MFWIGMLVGMIIASIAIIGFVVFCCKVTYGDWETFDSMVNVVRTASDNRESEVRVYHEGEILEVAIFEELD